jgi:hypothetical protein
MHGSTGGDWKRSKKLDHGRWGGTADRETGGTKAPGPTVRRSHRASPRPYIAEVRAVAEALGIKGIGP